MRTVLLSSLIVVHGVAAVAQTHAGSAPYCDVTAAGTAVLANRPTDSETPVDDVNWFARPVPNPRGHWIVGFASHNQNYLYDLTTGRRIRIPDRSDAVATPDGRYITVPSHYTSTRSVNFYDAEPLLGRLEKSVDAADVAPVFAHEDPDVADVYYQSVGIVSSRTERDRTTTVYRMMFSGSNVRPAPGFRIVDYTFTTDRGRLHVTPSRAMRLCPEIVRDMATPFISKDGRYVAAHDGGDASSPGSLKIFEITSVNPEAQTTSCAVRVDFGFAAGKADFSFDGARLAFHISKHDYLTPFVNGGLNAPAITDVVVVDLARDATGGLTGYGGLARVTTSTEEGVGSYFPAFFPKGELFYLANTVPKNSDRAKRFRFVVVDPAREVFVANLFADDHRRALAESVGELWREACAPDMRPFKPGEAPWTLLSLTPRQCEQLVEERAKGDAVARARLAEMCRAGSTRN